MKLGEKDKPKIFCFLPRGWNNAAPSNLLKYARMLEKEFL